MSDAGTDMQINKPQTQQAVAADCCTWCGLPAGVAKPVADENAPKHRQKPDPENIYCCYGCRFAHAVVKEQGAEGAIRWTVIRLGLAIFFTMNLMAFTMTMWSLDVYNVEADPFQQTLFEVFRWLSMVLALPVLLLLGIPLLQNAIASWRQKIYSTDLLIALAVAAAYVISAVNVVRETGTIYFEVGATVLVMITLGRWIEAVGKQKATEALDKLMALQPDFVSKVSDAEADQEISIAATDVVAGDILHVRAGERFAVDSQILRGQTSVDEQVFTGESLPVPKSAGDSVLAGTVNLDGDILVQATSALREGSFGRLLDVLREARNARGYYQRMADKAASVFFPLITLVAASAFAWHLSAGIDVALQVAMSVLLIACPCALGLATPLAVWTALSTAVKHQVLFRSGEAIERLAQVKAVCCDKTGTLTTGNPRVFQTAFFSGSDRQQAMALAEHLANLSSHPFSRAVATCISQQTSEDSLPAIIVGIENLISSVRTISGGGVEAVGDNGRLFRLGSVEFSCCSLHQTQQSSVAAPELCVTCRSGVPLGVRVQLDRLRMAADQQAASIVLLSIDRAPAVGFLIAESIRPDATNALKELSKQVDELLVLSGDRPAKGRFLKEQLNVAGLTVECGLNPQQKVDKVLETRSKFGTTVMVGDGINDAPALAASDVGIAMGCGTDVSRDSAQVCLLSNDLSRIPWAIDLARRTRTVIRQNLFWAFGYNSIGVCLAASGRLNPATAAGLMIASSLLVISNSLRLLNAKTTVTGETPKGIEDNDDSGQRTANDQQPLESNTATATDGEITFVAHTNLNDSQTKTAMAEVLP